MDGVIRTRVGYCGGTTVSPTYQRIGDHSETVEVDYDPQVLTYDDLLAAFFAGHDPRMRSYSTQYRSAVFYRTTEEAAAAGRALERLQLSAGLMHTSVEPLSRFWLAEDYHQKFHWKQFTHGWRGEPAGQVPNWKSREFCEWASKRGISGCAAGKNAGKESAVAGLVRREVLIAKEQP